MAPSSAKSKLASTSAGTPAGGIRFIPIEANTAFLPNANAQPRQSGLPKNQPPTTYSIYAYPPPGHPPPSAHYNPQQTAHPYFFPPVLAHQPGAHLPNPHLPPSSASPTPLLHPSQGPASTSAPPPESTSAASSNTADAPPKNAASAKKSTKLPKPDTTPPLITTAEHILERAKKAAAQTPNPATNTNSTVSSVNINPRYPPKGVNSAARPLTHPNPEALGLTRMSPPPQCHYPSPEIINTVVNAWAVSRGYRLSRQKSDRNAAGDMYKQYYLCTRHGQPTNTHKVTPETRQRKQRKSERIGCPMGLVVRAVDASNIGGDWTVRWQLEGKSEWHNHGPATEDEIAAEKARSDRNERRKASRGLGNGKRGRRLKDPNKPARKRDRRKKKPEQQAATEAVNGGEANAGAEAAMAGNGSVASTAPAASMETQPNPLLQSSSEPQPQQIHEQQLEQGHAQQLQQELSSSLQSHDLSALASPQHQPQQMQQHHLHQRQQQYSQPQHRPHSQLSQLSHTQSTSQRSQQQSQPSSQQQQFSTQALPNLWGLSNANVLTQHQQQQNHHQQQQQNHHQQQQQQQQLNHRQQQQQQQQVFRNYGYGQSGGSMGYR